MLPQPFAPSIGLSKENLEAGFYRYYFNFLAENQVAVNVTPYLAASVMNKVTSY